MNISNKLRQICLFCVFMDVLPVGFVYYIAAGGGGGGRKGLKNCQAQVKKLQQSTLTFMRA